MKQLLRRFILFVMFLPPVLAFGQTQTHTTNTNCPGVPGACGYPAANPNPAARNGPNQPAPQNGNGTLGVIYDQAKCGLDFTSASQRLGKRFSPQGINQPAPFPISGIPACAVIEKAYLWAEGSGNGAAQTATVNGPLGSANYPMAIVGQGPDKCWSYSGSYTYRADVTPSVNGNGTYNISGLLTNPPTSGNDMDGATLLVIWSVPSANFQGRIVIADGAIVVNGGTSNYNMPISPAVCGATTGARAFGGIGDIQMAVTSLTLNSTATPIAWNWWNFETVNTTVAAGATTANFSCNTGGDCFNFCVAGVYFRTTTCATCPTTTAFTVNTTSTPASCSACNGTATATVSPAGSYTYTWSPAPGSGQGTATPGNMCAGNYTVTVVSACATVTATVNVATAGGSITTSGTQTNVTCNGSCNGTATTSIVTGTGPFTYVWAPAPGGGQGTATATGLCAGTYTCTVTGAGGCTGTQSFTITQPPAITATQSQVNVLCNGACTGSATVVASGGTGTYTYAWAPSGGTGATATGLCAGTYTCTISSPAGCTRTVSVTITQPPALTATTSVTAASCGNPNGSATVTASGGTGGYTYSWAPSGGTGSTATGLGAGSYTVTVTDANGCVITRTVTITNAGSPTATISAQTNVTCNGGNNGSATVTATGGSGGYTYSWAPSGGTGATASGLSAGTYTVTVTDAGGCTTTASVTITQPPPLSATQSQVNVLCNGACTGSASVVASGGTGTYTYAWAPSGGTGATATALCAGTYTCTISSPAGCTITRTFNITQPPALTTTGAQTNILCNGAATGSATVTATGGTGSYTYSWAPSGGTGSTATGLTAGSYTCTVTDANGCTTTRTFTITQPTALTATTSTVQATCGNPNGSATVTASGGTGGYTYSWAPSGGTGSTATGLSAGSYTVTVTDANGCTITRTVTITNAGSPTATISASTNVSCFAGTNGSATVTASGGAGGYTYAWAPSGGTGTTASGLGAGTYTVTVTDANGCTATASVTITQPTALTASAVSTPVLCNGGNTGTATVTGTGGTGAYTYAWAPSGGTGSTANNLTAGSYTCTVTDANGCTATASTTITQPPALTTTASQVNELCFGGNNGSATVTPSGGTGTYTYNWAPAPGGGQGTNNAINLTAQGYTVTITDANGCVLTQTFVITEPTALTVSTSTTPSTCGNANGSATATPAGGTGTVTYLWTPGNITTATLSNVMAGSYAVTITDANGCTASAVATINNMGSPSAAITAATNILCNGGNNGSATVTVTGGTGTPTYAWAPSGGTNATETNMTAGSYTVTVTDANGCTDTAQVTLTEPPLLTASATFLPVLCNGGTTGSAMVTTNGGTGVPTYAWAPSGGTGATESNLAAGSYTCTVTDANGCTTTASTTVTEPPALTTTASQVDELCFNGNTGSATVTPSGGTGTPTYAWSPAGGTGATESNLVAGNYTCTITDANGCFITQTFTITEPTQLVASATAVDAHCNQADGSATATTTGGTGTVTYAWQPSGTGATISNIVAGTYTVIATDANGCTSGTTIVVNNLNGVNAAQGPVTNVDCFGASTGQAIVTQAGGNPGYTYAWTPNVSTSDTASAIAAGSYQVTVTDADGCTSSVTITVTEPPQLTITAASAPSSVCEGTSVQLTATPGGGVPTYTMTWNPGNLSGGTQNLVPNATTTYTVDVVDQNGCTATANTTVTVFPVPVAALSANILSGCAPQCITFSDLSTVAAASTITGWSWDFGDGNTSTQQTPVHCYTTSGIFTVILTVTTGDGCTNTITMPSYIEIYANPVAAFGASPQPTTLVNPQIFFTDSSTNASQWFWSFGDLANSSSILQNPSFTYPDATCYQVVLTVTSVDGCTDSTFENVCIGPDVSIFVPNAFTPDGDGLNEVFIPVTIGIDPEQYELWIFDRWGNMLFYTDDLTKGWDGSVQGKGGDICQIDTYVWVIKAKDLNGGGHNLRGKTSIVK